MKLYEAIELGNTLIGESHRTFYSGVDNCGCAIGSAMAAKGVIDCEKQATKFFSDWLEWCVKTWPWTGKTLEETGLENLEIFSHRNPYGNVAEAISITHISGVKRMEIAQAIKSYEDSLEVTEEKECQTLKT